MKHWDSDIEAAMKQLRTGLLTITFLLFPLIHTPLCFSETHRTPTPALATVNDTAIYPKDLAREMGQLRAEMILRNRPLSDRQLDRLRSQFIENIIDRELLYQHAQQKNIQIRSQWIGATLKELQDQLGSRSALKTYLANSGLNQEELEERIRKGLIVRRLLRREALRTIRVSEAEIQAFYRKNAALFDAGEKIRVRHILVAVNDPQNKDDQTAALSKIQTLQRRIEAGEKLAVLALDYSDCPSKARGGDLGYLALDQMVSDFASAVADLKPGQISDIVTTRFGYHLIQMIDRQPATTESYRAAREKIERTLRRNKENAAAQKYVATLKRQANIVRHGSNP